MAAPPTIANYLAYANLQMAAEAFLLDKNGTPFAGDQLISALTFGNGHASVFTQTQATDFADPVKGWTVVAQSDGTYKTGFSGTLFRNNQTGELVISFRSTEFIDDAARDNEATNRMEIASDGWAFGQISDMQAWYKSLKDGGLIPDGSQLSVTGYSLGGHLATAFNMLYPNAAQQVVTFNGAGVGKVTQGTLSDVMAYFNSLRNSPDNVDAAITDPALREVIDGSRGYLNLAWQNSDAKGLLAAIANAAAAVDKLVSLEPLYNNPVPTATPQETMVLSALQRMAEVVGEAGRAPTMPSGSLTGAASPVNVPFNQIAQAQFDYQMAVLLASQRTKAAPLVYNALQTFFGRRFGSPILPNQYDLMGDTSPSAVSNSQLHYGNNVTTFIEDQPIKRGSVVWNALTQSLEYQDIKLLVPNYTQNDFGDTHSLVLIVDSLSVQNTLIQLIPASQRDASAQTIGNLLNKASNAYAKSDSDQGTADGESLDNIVNELGEMLLPPGAYTELVGNDQGNTWWEVKPYTGTDGTTFSGRADLYAALGSITGSDAFQKLTGDLSGHVQLVSAPTNGLSAKRDFGALLSLLDLAPFELKGIELDSVWSAAQSVVFKQWQDDRTADANGSTAARNFSDQYLTARAEMNVRLSYYNGLNAQYDSSGPNMMYDTVATQYDGEDIIWKDLEYGVTIRRGAPTSVTRYVIFGADGSSDTLQGGPGDSRLFAGTDSKEVLRAGAKNDYLEGGRGSSNDTLIGGAGHDTLDAGNGDTATLVAGTGGDTLIGGSGVDTFQFATGDGADTIIDSKGKGKIVIDGTTLAGGKAITLGGQVWKDATNDGVHYTLIANPSGGGQDLWISYGAASRPDSVVVKNYTQGMLGIQLQGAAPSPAPSSGPANLTFDASQYTTPTNVVTGSYHLEAGDGDVFVNSYVNQNVLLTAGSAGSQLQLDWNGPNFTGNGTLIGGSGNDTLGANFNLNSSNVVIGWGGADHIQTWGGNSRIYANQEVSIETAIEAQKTATATFNGMFSDTTNGNNTIVGGNGSDFIKTADGYTGQGKSPAETLFHATENVIVTGAGNDTVVGGANTYAVLLPSENFPLAGWGLNSNLSHYLADSNLITTAVLNGIDNDTIYGGNGDSEYWLGNGNNYVQAGNGNDFIRYGTGSNAIFGGSGNDTIVGASDGAGGAVSSELQAPELFHFTVAGGDSYFVGNGFATGMSQAIPAGMTYIVTGDGNDLVLALGGSNVIVGGAGNDTIYSGNNSGAWAASGTDSRNYIFSGSGNSTVYGSAGQDTLVSGSIAASGKTTKIYAGNGNEWLIGGAGADSLYGGSGNDTIDAGDGNTLITAGSGNTAIHGGTGADTIYGGSGNNAIDAGDGNALITAGSGRTTINGGAGSDTITGGSGMNVIWAGDGGTFGAPTIVRAGSGSSTITGGAGVSQLYGGAGGGMLVAGSGTSTLQGGSGTEVMYGGSGNATLIGGAGDVEFHGGTGNTTIFAGSGSNTYLDMGTGNTELVGAGGSGIFQFGAGVGASGFAVGIATGTDGAAALTIDDGGGLVTIDNGLGGAIGQFKFADGSSLTLDQLISTSYAVQAAPVTVAGAHGNSIYALGGGNTITGGVGNDTLVGWNGGNLLVAGTGNQTLYGKSGYDTLVGGGGDDTLVSAVGNSTLVGGTGNTTFVINSVTDIVQAQLSGSNVNTVQSSVNYVLPDNVQNFIGTGSADLVLTGNASQHTIVANTGNDTLIAGAGVATLVGGSGNNTFAVNNAGDVVQAQATGSNVNTIESSVNYALPDNVQYLTLTGAADLVGTGNDLDNVITGNAGNDTLIAGGGNDTLIAGSGLATLVGGAGNDTFVVNNIDDVVQAQSTGGNVNTIESSVSYALLDNVQHLTLTGGANLVGTGNDLDNVITGNDGNDTLIAGSGNDTLVAGSGGGTLIGGAGADTFVLNGGGAEQTIISLPTTNADVIEFSDAISIGDVRIFQQGADLLVKYGQDGSALIKDFAPNGADGSQVIGRFDFADGSGAYVTDGQGKASLQAYRGDGSLAGDFWQDGDTYGNDVYDEGGASSRTSYSQDGSRTAVADDGQGNVTTTNYDTAGNEVRASWTASDGAFGNTVFHEDGSFEESSHAANGSYIVDTRDARGNEVTTWYDVAGNKIRDTWVKALPNGDAAYGNDNFNPNGTYASSFSSDAGFLSHGDGNFNTRRTYFDGNGVKTSDEWHATDGSFGTDTFNVDGSSSGMVHQSDGNRSTYINDGHGDTSTTLYDSDGVKRSTAWTEADGSHGGYTFNADGTITGTRTDADGTTVAFTNIGSALTLWQPIAGQAAVNGQAWNFTVPGATFLDADGRNIVSYSAALADGSALPSWISFDPATLAFSGTPGSSDVGDLNLTVTATDSAGLQASGTFALNVMLAVDHPPVVSQTIANQSATEGSAWTFVVPASTFTDPDAGDALSFSAKLASGKALPSWLSFDAASQTFSGTPPLGHAGRLSVRVTATDCGGAGVSTSFALTLQAPDTVYTAVNYAAEPGVHNIVGTGTANILLTGNSLANTITANAGNDTLVAGSGLATLIGGLGSDVFKINNSADVVVAQDSATHNTVVASVSYVAPANVQELKSTGSADLALTGGAQAIVIVGNAGNDTLTAGSGDATLVAGTGLATLVGGMGHNVFRIDNTGDVIQLQTDALGNLVETSVNYTATVGVQKIVGTGSADLALGGGPGSVAIVGNAGNDTLIAGSGDATLVAGTGLATLVGGSGSNIFRIDNIADVVQAQAGASSNTIETSVSYAASDNVQKIVGTGTADLVLIGGAQTTVIIGNGGNDTLTAGYGDATLVAGMGLATLVGGAGNNLFRIDNAGDVILIQANALSNTVETSVSYAAQAGVQKVAGFGTADIVLTGNDLANVLVGNGGNDTLTAGSGDATLIAGAGLATLVGGSGSNTFKINSSADVVIARAGATLNAVITTADFAAPASVQTVTAVGTNGVTLQAGSGDVTLIGNAGNDTLIGGSGNATLVAGSGVSTLVGGTGSTTFKINNAADVVTQQAGAGLAIILANVNYVLPDNVEDLFLTGGGSFTAVGNANGGVNLIVGNAGFDTLAGGTGVNVLESGTGRASMSASAAAVMLGGAKADKLTAGAAGAFIDGGAGTDTITLGGSNSVIAFNQGDGRDTVVGGSSTGNILSLGGGIAEGNIAFSKSGTNLILTTGTGDAIVFQNWYATGAVHDVSTLQLIEQASGDYSAGSSNVLVNNKIEEFDFTALVSAFDKARAKNSALTSWSLMNGLLSAHLASGDTAALGGDLAYWDGLNGNLTGMDLTAAASAVSDPNFGKTAQDVHGWNIIAQSGNPLV